MSTRMTRREMLRYVGLGSAASVLAACAPKVVKETVIVEKPVEKVVEKVVKETVIVAGTPKVVEKVVKVKETVVVEKGKDIFQGELAVWHGWGNTHGGGLAMIDLTDRFMEMYPDVKVLNVYDAGGDKILTALASGEGPDTFVTSAQNIPVFAERGALMNLDPFVQRDNLDLNQYFNVAIEQCSWRDRLYAMTHHPDIRVFYRNRAIMSEVGLDPDKNPQSWDDVHDWGVEMSKQDDKGNYVRLGYVASWTAGSWAHLFMQANGVSMLSEDGRKVMFNNDKSVDALNWAVKCVDDICGGRDNIVEFQEANATPQGKRFIWMFPLDLIGMALYGNWMTHQISVVNAELDFGVGMFPGGPSGEEDSYVFGGGTMMVIPQQAKHWELAWEWLKFLGSKEGGWLVQKRTGDISGRIDSAKDPKVVQEHLGRGPMVELFEKANKLSYLKSPIGSQFNDEMTRMQEQILLEAMTVKEGVDSAAKAVQDALDEYWRTA